MVFGILLVPATATNTEQNRAEEAFRRGYDAAVEHSVRQRYGDFFDRFDKVIVSERYGNPSIRCSVSEAEMTARCTETTYVGDKAVGKNFTQIPVTDDELRMMKKVAKEK